MTKTIASLYFMPLKARRPLYGGVFDIPAVPKGGKPALLTVNDHIQLEQQPHITGGGKIPRQIRGEEVAADIVKEWAANGLGMSGDCGPAVWVVRDSVPLLEQNGMPIVDAEKRAQFRPATEEERAQMWTEDLAEQTARQDRWCDWLIGQGDVYDADPEQKRRVWITDTMCAGAKHVGHTANWVNRSAAKSDATKACPFCTKTIPTASVVCQYCSNVVDRAKYEALTAKPPISPPLRPTKEQQSAA